MKRYFGDITTQFMGMEWGQSFLLSGPSLEYAESLANGTDWTHGDGIEEQEEAYVREIPEEHYQVLQIYMMEL